MHVFKFGGASVKDASGVINLGNILTNYADKNLLIVVSAMGKTTDLLEELTQCYFQQKEDCAVLLQQLKTYHNAILTALFPDENHPVYNQVANLFVEIEWVLEEPPMDGYDYLYDQIVAV